MSASEDRVPAAVAEVEAALAAGGVTDADLQRLIASVAVAYGARRRREDGSESAPEPFPDPAQITRGDVATLACAMLDAVDMDVFELQMWKSLGPA